MGLLSILASTIIATILVSRKYHHTKRKYRRQLRQRGMQFYILEKNQASLEYSNKIPKCQNKLLNQCFVLRYVINYLILYNFSMILEFHKSKSFSMYCVSFLFQLEAIPDTVHGTAEIFPPPALLIAHPS